MKKIVLMLLVSVGSFAQKQVFNVQQYCIDEEPVNENDCDVKGNEYSFVFVDDAKREVIFFLTDLKFQYQIADVKSNANGNVYSLKNKSGFTEMTIDNAKTNIEFISPERRIKLIVGKSTKLGH